MSDTETRIVNEETGGAKGQKLAAFDLLPQDALWELARLYGVGALKYDPRNWEKGYDWNLSYAAAQRHLNLFWSGEDYDPELKEKYDVDILHVICAAWHCMALAAFTLREIGNDNRAEGAKIGGKTSKSESDPGDSEPDPVARNPHLGLIFNHEPPQYPWNEPPWTIKSVVKGDKVDWVDDRTYVQPEVLPDNSIEEDTRAPWEVTNGYDRETGRPHNRWPDWAQEAIEASDAC